MWSFKTKVPLFWQGDNKEEAISRIDLLLKNSRTDKQIQENNIVEQVLKVEWGLLHSPLQCPTTEKSRFHEPAATQISQKSNWISSILISDILHFTYKQIKKSS